MAGCASWSSPDTAIAGNHMSYRQTARFLQYQIYSQHALLIKFDVGLDSCWGLEQGEKCYSYS